MKSSGKIRVWLHQEDCTLYIVQVSYEYSHEDCMDVVEIVREGTGEVLTDTMHEDDYDTIRYAIIRWEEYMSAADGYLLSVHSSEL